MFWPALGCSPTCERYDHEDEGDNKNKTANGGNDDDGELAFV
jgi:hypothetical protein